MTKTREKKIDALVSQLEDFKAEIEILRDEEREQFDNMSDKAQEGDKGVAVDEAATKLETACDELENVIGEMRDSIPTE